MVRFIVSGNLPAPFSNYSHGVVIPEGHTLVLCSGQLGISQDMVVPEGAADQTRLCFNNVAAILDEAKMSLRDVVKINAFVTAREHMAGYMEVRNALFPKPFPASTLMIVSGFSRPEFVVEVEVTAVRRSS